MYYLLDGFSGNILKTYKTTIEACKELGGAPAQYSSVSAYYKSIVNGSFPSAKRRRVNGFVFVKKDLYDKFADKIIKELQSDNIYLIDSKGNIVGEAASTGSFFSVFSRKNLNDRTISKNGIRIATKEFYLDAVSKDPFYYSKQIERESKRKVRVNMYDSETGNFIKRFDSITKAAEHMGCSKENIRMSILENRNVLKTKYFFKKGE